MRQIFFRWNKLQVGIIHSRMNSYSQKTCMERKCAWKKGFYLAVAQHNSNIWNLHHLVSEASLLPPVFSPTHPLLSYLLSWFAAEHLKWQQSDVSFSQNQPSSRKILVSTKFYTIIKDYLCKRKQLTCFDNLIRLLISPRILSSTLWTFTQW